MITFRKEEEKDRQFIEQVYRSTREKEMNLTEWSEEQKLQFIQMQLHAQLFHYKRYYPGATYDIVLYKKQPAGRLYLWETEHEIRVVDISLLPACTGRGIGRKILTDLLQSAKQKNKKISLHVPFGNPAKKLYESIGFVQVSTTDTRDYMECIP